MKKVFLALLCLVGAIAWAGTSFQVVDTNKLPSQATDGVRMEFATACRGTVYTTDGGSIMGGKLIPYWYNSNFEWQQGPTSLECNLSTSLQTDGGPRLRQICEWEVINNYGRASIVPSGLLQADGGPATGLVRTECYGPKILDTTGSSK